MCSSQRLNPSVEFQEPGNCTSPGRVELPSASGLDYLSRIIHDQLDDVIEFDRKFWRHDSLDIWVEIGGQVNDIKKAAPAAPNGPRGAHGRTQRGR